MTQKFHFYTREQVNTFLALSSGETENESKLTGSVLSVMLEVR